MVFQFFHAIITRCERAQNALEERSTHTTAVNPLHCTSQGIGFGMFMSEYVLVTWRLSHECDQK